MDATTTVKSRHRKKLKKRSGGSSARSRKRVRPDQPGELPAHHELVQGDFVVAAGDMFDVLLRWCFANRIAPAQGLRDVVSVLGETLYETVVNEESDLSREIDLEADEACTLLADEVMYRVFGKLAESGEGDARDLALAMDQLSAFMHDVGSPEAFLDACGGD